MDIVTVKKVVNFLAKKFNLQTDSSIDYSSLLKYDPDLTYDVETVSSSLDTLCKVGDENHENLRKLHRSMFLDDLDTTNKFVTLLSLLKSDENVMKMLDRNLALPKKDNPIQQETQAKKKDYPACESFISFEKMKGPSITEALVQNQPVYIPWKLDSLPVEPAWADSRKYSNFCFVDLEKETVLAEETNNLDGMLRELDIRAQEEVLLEDLLFLFMGVQGRFLKLIKDKDSFELWCSSSVDSGLREVIMHLKTIPIAYHVISEFLKNLSSLKNGRTAQALSAAMEELLTQYLNYISTLEQELNNKSLTLHKLMAYSHRIHQQITPLQKLALSLNKGELSSIRIIYHLYENLQHAKCSGISDQVFHYLINKSCVPFFESLKKWIFYGVIFDPYHEFMIVKNDITVGNLDKNTYNYWKKKLTLDKKRVPPFLENIANKILLTGKYLGVMNQFEKSINNQEGSDLSLEDDSYIKVIEDAYTYATNKLLQLIVHEKKLLDHMRTMKNFFMLSRGDFYTIFMDGIEKELNEASSNAALQRMESLLEIALSSCSFTSNVYTNNLSITFLSSDLQTQVNSILNAGIRVADSNKAEPLVIKESLSFNYDAQWPISLVINSKCLVKYQMMFRHLFAVKYIERQLSKLWQFASKLFFSKKIIQEHGKNFIKSFLCTNMKMLHFIQSYIYHLMFEVIESNWESMEQKLKNANSIDDVIKDHDIFLTQCLNGFLLINSKLSDAIFKSLNKCKGFATWGLAILVEGESDIGVGAHFDQLKLFNSELTTLLIRLIRLLRSSSSLASEQYMNSLASRLDQNGYYSTVSGNRETQTVSS